MRACAFYGKAYSVEASNNNVEYVVQIKDPFVPYWPMLMYYYCRVNRTICAIDGAKLVVLHLINCNCRYACPQSYKVTLTNLGSDWTFVDD